MPRDERAGFPTYWTTFGQGPRAALAIHAGLQSSASWGGLARYLSGALTITAFDMPGHGRSGPWDGRGEIQGVTAEIAAAFPEAPVDVLGHSFGATVALRLAVARPGLVRSLVLIEPPFFAVAFADHPEMRATLAAETAGFTRAMAAGDHLAAAEAFVAIWGDETPWAEVPTAQREILSAQMPLIAAGHGALYQDVGGLLKPGALDVLDMPVSLIEGSRSPGIIGAIHEGLAARLPQAERAVIIGAGHMAPITHPAQVSDEVLRFLRQV